MKCDEFDQKLDQFGKFSIKIENNLENLSTKVSLFKQRI